MYAILWEFRVPAERRAEFETAYGPDGPWALLFAKAAGLVGVELLRRTEQAVRYLTIDRWRSRRSFEKFKDGFSAEYEALDRKLEGIADSETRIGAFDALLPGSDAGGAARSS
ncbi:MAG: antibiotic biosynthesis monooxygenase family protein [Dongiaceae bacterium]